MNHKLSPFFLLLAGFALPASIAVTKVGLGFAALLGLWQYRRADWAALARLPIVQAFLGFFILLALGLSYSSAPFNEAFWVLSKYQQLLYFPLLLLLFKHSLAQRWGESVFLWGLSAVLLFSYLGAADIWVLKPEHPAIPTKNRITQSILLALGVYLCLNQLRYSKLSKNLTGFLYLFVVLATANILFICQGRSGYLVLAALLLLWIWQSRHAQRGLFLGLGVLALLAAFSLSYYLSTGFAQRIDELWIALFEPNTVISSSSLRLEFLKNSWQLIQQQAWWGSGTGSFAHEYRLAFADTWTLASHNPHNEYLHLWVQLGLVGLLLLPTFLVWMYWQTQNLARQQGDKIQALLMMLAVGCLFNSLLLDFTEMTVFVYLLAHIWSCNLKTHD